MELIGNFSEIQVRVLGCLIEKQATTPEQYPLTVNSLKNACNQKSSRDPVVNYEEGQVGHALRELEALELVSQAWSTRAAKYEQHCQKVLGLRQKDIAVLCILMLRGPQTAGEIRTRSQRLYEFDDIDDVEYVLKRLIEHEPAIVMQLPKQPGQSIQRYAHLLCGEPDLKQFALSGPVSSGSSSELEERVSHLESEIQTLNEKLDRLVEQLGSD